MVVDENQHFAWHYHPLNWIIMGRNNIHNKCSVSLKSERYTIHDTQYMTNLLKRHSISYKLLEHIGHYGSHTHTVSMFHSITSSTINKWENHLHTHPHVYKTCSKSLDRTLETRFSLFAINENWNVLLPKRECVCVLPLECWYKANKSRFFPPLSSTLRLFHFHSKATPDSNYYLFGSIVMKANNTIHIYHLLFIFILLYSFVSGVFFFLRWNSSIIREHEIDTMQTDFDTDTDTKEQGLHNFSLVGEDIILKMRKGKQEWVREMKVVLFPVGNINI